MNMEPGTPVVVTPPNGPEMHGIFLGLWHVNKTRAQVFIPETDCLWRGGHWLVKPEDA